MTNRKTWPTTTILHLLGQVEESCPLCDKGLFVKKGARIQKHYEIAHIYPLHPKPHELILLKDVPRLSEDPDDDNNLIPLCGNCHTTFDNPRTVDGYMNVYEIKQAALLKSVQRALAGEHDIEAAIAMVIESLLTDEELQKPVGLDYDPKTLDRKLTPEIDVLTRRKIRTYVADYFSYVRRKLAEADGASPGAANIIATQVKLYYLHQSRLGLTRQQVFKNVVQWLVLKTPHNSEEAAEIVASFFIQNCEIFE